MENWIKVTLILCAFGTLREIRPSEPFVTEFLSGEWRNVTREQVIREVYPVGTYSYLAQLVFVFLITDFMRFKPVIILSGISGIAVYAILLWTKSLLWLQVSQFFYGMYSATEVAYLTYIYAKVDPAKYPVVSSYTRIAALTGRSLSGLSSQLLTHWGLMDYRQLNYITFIAQILATFWAFWLPPVQYGIYFHRKDSVVIDNTPIGKKPTVSAPDKKVFTADLVEAFTLISKHARTAFTRPNVLAWSFLYASALALFFQAQTYVQVLWQEIRDVSGEDTARYNGAVEFLQTLLGVVGAFIASFCAHAFLPAPAAAIQGVALFLGTNITSVFVSYAGYIVMGMLYHYIITLASAKIASQLSDESCFGLIFGINTLLGTGLQSIITLVIVQTLTISIFTQFYIVSGMLLILSTLWLLGWIVQNCKQKQSVNLSKQY